MISVTMPKNGNAMMYTSGWPKNQNRCCHRIAPPLADSNTCACKCRSTQSTSSAAVRMGKASSTSRLVTMMFQVKIGIRNIVMPGQRSVITVVTMLTAPRIVPRPAMAKPISHRSVPEPGELIPLLSGA
jgi:hypothetical protein